VPLHCCFCLPPAVATPSKQQWNPPPNPNPQPRRSFATVIRHRTDEERSSVYERLIELEAAAKTAKRGVHSSKEVAAPRTNDVSLPGNAARAKQYLPFFSRAGKVAAVVEYVLSGHRLKVRRLLVLLLVLVLSVLRGVAGLRKMLWFWLVPTGGRSCHWHESCSH